MKNLMEFRLLEGKYETYNSLKQTRLHKNRTIDQVKTYIRKEVDNIVNNILPKSDMEADIEDQSIDDKGIKYQVNIGNDIIHIFFLPYNNYEIYLNKKRSNIREISKYLQNKHMTPLEIALQMSSGYDYYVEYIDNGTQYNNAKNRNSEIFSYFQTLSTSDKKIFIKELKKRDPKNDRIDLVFKV